MNSVVQPVILCGGSGTRLWPISTPGKPKQFLSLLSERSMIEETSDRFAVSRSAGVSFAEPVVVGSQANGDLIRTQLPHARLILEPFGRNSAPAVAAAALAVNPDAIVLILPADHSIKKVPAFHKAIETALAAVKDGAIITFGVTPDQPATGYGYIRYTQSDAPVRKVEEFVEKPQRHLAEHYLQSGNYVWNAGIFMFRASTMISALERYAPEILEAVRAAMPGGTPPSGVLDPERFATAPDISIDYAVMEKAENISVVPVDIGWSDVGDYQAIWELSRETPHSAIGQGAVYHDGCKRVLIRAQGVPVMASGVDNIVAVTTEDVVMIVPHGDSNAVKALRKTFLRDRDRLSMPAASCEKARDWLWSAFDVWKEVAWDDAQGGFVEQLSLDGVPDRGADRRTRVQARQVYSFSQAIVLGWPGSAAATDLVAKGVDYILAHARHPDGGFVHRLNADGSVNDDLRDAYDHAFFLLAAAGAVEATGSDKARRLGDEALTFLSARLADPEHGGVLEGEPAQTPRRANPHMHLLEASLAWHRATKDPRALDMAKEVVALFESRFFDVRENVMAEFFTQDWTIVRDDPRGIVFEPGHHYEWASLLAFYDRLTGHDSRSWRARLIATADRRGLDAASGFAHNCAYSNGEPSDANRRLWPQLEMLRARLIHPETASIGAAHRLFDTIFDTYLDPAPSGCWIDQTDASGKPNADAIPASILYHMVTAFAPMIAL